MMRAQAPNGGEGEGWKVARAWAANQVCQGQGISQASNLGRVQQSARQGQQLLLPRRQRGAALLQLVVQPRRPPLHHRRQVRCAAQTNATSQQRCEGRAGREGDGVFGMLVWER